MIAITPFCQALRRPTGRWIPGVIGICALLLWLGTMAAGNSLLAAEDAKPAPPPPAAAAAPNDFGQYLIDHEDDLAPFFSKYNDDLSREGAPLLIALLGRIAFFTLIAGWVIDVILSRCFSAFFAPVYAKLKRAFLYASGRLMVSTLSTIAACFFAGWCFSIPNLAAVFVILIVLVFLVALGIQVWWVSYLYRMGLLPSGVFYLALIAVHSVLAVTVIAPILGTGAPHLWTVFMNQNVVTKLKAETVVAKKELAEADRTRDAAVAQLTEAQNRVTQAATDLQNLQKEIEEKKNSEPYVFSRIAKVRAQGDLTAARDQLNDFIAKFPSGNLLEAAKAQLAGVNADIATQTAQKKQADADAVAAAAQARAELLDHASKGQATLSDMREALVGKTLTEVNDLLGPPDDTASGRWGYQKQMIENPITHQRFGLTVIFVGGTVQGVDYYYGKGAVR